MKKDIILAGVGGQGILTIATIIADAATAAGLKLKQAEVHGMSQRGGDALRYLPYLAGDGWIVTSSHTFRNIPDYPEEDALFQELGALPHVATLPIEDVAKDNGLPKSANVVLLGMAAKYIEILSVDQLRQSVVRIFGAKSEKMVEANLKAFELGLAAVNSFN